MGGGSSSSSSLFSKALFGTLVVLGFILVLLVGTLQSEGNKTKTTLTTEPSSSTGKRQEHVKVLARGKLLSDGHPQLDLNYMSKRRVPNGPDPIHNRRTGNSRRPPGQA
ncbi:CLAVATA3/ESR (CLE)-related protein 25 [Herrania umbratica]|uniref:CLAVATA3/ESR (CLE)-related protein 25 n=1 Tax=Herrania umbratica TaxID=108875 RepID=A0A6J1B218_9ROSI|nr:CLAVATA3/ESR (CLE)-related protein 25 [Herrania umbratica]